MSKVHTYMYPMRGDHFKSADKTHARSSKIRCVAIPWKDCEHGNTACKAIHLVNKHRNTVNICCILKNFRIICLLGVKVITLSKQMPCALQN